MPEPDPLPLIKTPWGSATPLSGAGAGARDVPPIPIPDHTLIRRVGKGSYGEVWLARNALGIYRAVKIIHRGSFDDDRPFEREFAGMQRFEPVSRSHESQLNILQVGRGSGCFYYVMELADDMGGAYASGGTSYTSPQTNPPGGTSSASPQTSPRTPTDSKMGTRVTRPSDSRGDSLNPDTYTPRNLRSELLLRGRLPVDECLRLGLALTTALENLHRHGLVHRDIKPSNIVFVNGIPKLADIGLVALAESTMSFVGTEGYLPPEGPGTVQADLFSLGKVLYEISTGHDRQQFPELPTGITELPDRAALAELNEVILRACAPDVKQRYESAAEMHADLALLQSGKSVARMRAVERRLRFVQRAGAVVTALAALIAAGWWWQARQTKLVRDLATENSRLLSLEESAHDRAQRSEQDTHRVLQFLLRRVVAAARPQDEDEGLGRDITVLQALQAAEPAIPEAFADQPQAELELRQSLAATFKLLGLPTNEVAHQQRALELSVRLLGPGSPEALTDRMDLAWALQRAGLTNECLTLLEQAWQTASNALGADDERTLVALGYVGVAYRQLDRGADSVRLLEAGVQRCRKAFGEDDLRTLDMVNHLAWSYHFAGQNERAVPLLEQTQRGRERVLGREHEATTRVMIDLGCAYQAVGREREAFKLLEEACEIRRQSPHHRGALVAMDVLALGYERAGRTNDALAWHTHAVDLRATKLGTNSASAIRTRNEIFRLRAALDAATNQPTR